MEIKRIAVFISGGGSTFKYIHEAIKRGELGDDTKIAVVVSSDPNAGGLKYAEDAGIPSCMFLRECYSTPKAFGEFILAITEEHEVDFICMAGFLKLMPENVLEKFKGRILNQHPGDTTKYGGPGMYGIRVHQAVLAAGEKRTCVTIHHATPKYDEGPILVQMWIDVPESITAEGLQKLLLPVEHVAYVAAIKALKALAV